MIRRGRRVGLGDGGEKKSSRNVGMVEVAGEEEAEVVVDGQFGVSEEVEASTQAGSCAGG